MFVRESGNTLGGNVCTPLHVALHAREKTITVQNFRCDWGQSHSRSTLEYKHIAFNAFVLTLM